MWFDRELSFSQHITAKIEQAMKSYGFIVRNCKTFTDARALLILYFSFVRSKLEYASIVWSPIYNCHKQSIETVQRKFLKFLSFTCDGFYPERGFPYRQLRDRFGLDSLDLRRKYASLSFLYHILHGGIDCSELVQMLQFFVPRRQTRCSITFHSCTPRTNILTKSPIFSMCSKFNSLSHACDIHSDGLPKILSLCSDLLDENVI